MPVPSNVVVYDPPANPNDSRVCINCLRVCGSWINVPYRILNTRTGKYHSGGAYGVTDCGIDATGEEYLWPV